LCDAPPKIQIQMQRTECKFIILERQIYALRIFSLIASVAKRRRRRRLRGAEQAHSRVMGSENSVLPPKILIFRKNGTDEKSLIFGG